MTSKIYIARKELDGPWDHSYFVFDPDGNPSSGDERIIRGGTTRVDGALSGPYLIEVDRPIAQSRDSLSDGVGEGDPEDPYDDRYYSTVASGSLEDMQDLWDLMADKARSLGTEEDDPWSGDENITISEHTAAYILNEQDYNGFLDNCNTLTRTIGEAGGIDVLSNLPFVLGDIGVERMLAKSFIGIESLFVGDGNDTVALDPSMKLYLDQGGADEYVLDPSALPDGQIIRIIEDGDTGSADKITLQNVDPNDVSVVWRSNGDMDIFVAGRLFPIITIVDQFDGGGAKINNLRIEPAVGSPVTVALSNPDNFERWHPTPLPSLFPGEIQPAFASAITAASPLVIDLSSSHTGVTLTTWSAGSTETFFDLNDNGFAVQTAWVSGDTGLLARDINTNGLIDSSAELFGSPTIDGFAKLAALDSNHDLRIDNNDDDWSTLVVWTDTNGDAVTQSGELHSLASLNIANIDLAGVASSTSTISGNAVSHVSTVTFTSGATAAIDDVWFVHDNTNSFFAGDYTLDAETLFLPTLRGYGTLPDLAIAMSLDSDLKDLVADFVGSFTMEALADASSSITDILYKWAGVDGVDPGSRGYNIDAQHLEFIEHLIGTDFFQTYTDSPDPQPTAAADLEDAYQTAFRMLTADLLIQVGVQELFDAPITYSPWSGMPEGDLALSHTAIDNLAGIAPSTGPENEAFWVALAGVLDTIKGIGNLTVSEAGWLDDAVTTSNALLDWSAVLNAFANENGTDSASGTSGANTLYGGTTDDTIHGYGGADVIYGSFGNDTLYGDDDADTVYGDAGNDTVNGGDGNDTLYGGDGNDTLVGEYGNDTYDAGTGGNLITDANGSDTYIYAGGDDVISDYSGTDQILLPSGVVLGDLTISRVSSGGSHAYFDDLLIQIDGGGSIQVYNHFSGSPVETLVFADTSTLDLTALRPDAILSSGNDSFSHSGSDSFNILGLAGNDTVYLTGSGTHTIDGGLGNDTLTGAAGNDTYIASAGFDTIFDSGGTDTIVVPDGYDLGDVTFYRINNGSGPTSHLGILISGLGEIAVTSQFSNSGYAVESLHFLSDTSTVSLTALPITTLGTAGNDSLTPPSYNVGPNDIMDGREGNDTLNAGLGDDTYIFSAGNDTINESGGGGNDTIRVRDSYAPGDITIGFYQDTGDYNNMRLTDSDGNTLIVSQQGFYSARAIEHIAFGDSTVWDLSSMELNTYGTSGNDYLAGHTVGDASSNDTMYGYDGNDTINGGVGNDVIYGGNGADTLSAKGTSVLYGDADDDNIFSIAGSGDTSAVVTMYGGDGADTLTAGNYGQSVMDGGNGADTLWGAGGTTVSTFLFDADTAFDAVDTIRGFTSGSGHDKIDISDVLDGYFDPLTELITDFVQFTTNGSNSEVYVDTTGSATFGAAQHIATIQSVTGLTDEAALVTAGLLIAA